RQWAEQADTVAHAPLGDAPGQGLAFGPVADDVAAHLQAVGGQQRHRVDEVGEALLLHQAADGDDHGRALGGALVAAAGQVEAVVGAHDTGCGVAVDGAQVGEVVVADGRDRGGIRQLAAQVVAVDLLVVDVLGVRREAVGHPGQRGGEPRHGGGDRAEVRVEVGDLSRHHGGGQLHRLHRVAHVGGEELVEVV